MRILGIEISDQPSEIADLLSRYGPLWVTSEPPRAGRPRRRAPWQADRVPSETDEERAWREARRVLFDTVADLYDATRPGYPGEVVTSLLGTAGIGPGAAVLEIGCGTGQLTQQLAGDGIALTALDLGPSMVAAARRRLAGADVTFVVSPFEAYRAPDASVDLIVSATAFHWLDPQVAWPKIARLLRPGGWLAVLGTRERYDDPLGAALRDVYLRYSADGGAWARRPPRQPADTIAGSGLFGEVVVREHRAVRRLPSETVLGLEHTRATSLGYDPATRARFTAEVRALLPPGTEVPLEQETWLAMAPLRAGAGA